MKKELLLFALVVLCPALAGVPHATAQALAVGQVPNAVIQGFQAKFPTIKVAEWKLKSDRNYEAEFTLKGTEIAAKFDSTGQWLETESAIGHSQVPKAVRSAADAQFKGYKIIERQSVERRNETNLLYELHLENSTEIVKAQFAKDGTLLGRSAKPNPKKKTKVISRGRV